MSDQDQDENLCPKCGAISASYEMCDSCGALLSRIRSNYNENKQEAVELPGRDAYAPGSFYAEPARRPWFTIIAICVLLAVAIAGGLFFSKQRAGEKARLKDSTATEVASPDSKDDSVPTTTTNEKSNDETQKPEASRQMQLAAPVKESPGELPTELVTPTPVTAGNQATADANVGAGQSAGMMGWLNSISKSTSAPSQISTTPTSPPAPQVAARATVSPIPSPQPATVRPAPKTAGKKGEINLGEDLFARGSGSPQPDRVTAALERIQPREAVQPDAQPDSAAQQQGVTIPIVNVTDSNFQSEVMMATKTTVLLGFFSQKVPASNQIAPTLLAIAQQQTPKVKVGVVDGEENKGLRQRYTVSDYPTSVLIKNGQEIARFGAELSQPAVNDAVMKSEIKNLPH